MVTGSCYPNHFRAQHNHSLKLGLKLWFLQFFNFVSWGISPEQILLIMQTTAIHHSIISFSSFSMFLPRISKPVVICSFCSFLCSFLLSLSFPSFYSFLLFFLFPVLFSPSVYSFYSLISLIVFFSNLSAILSFLFSLLYFVCFSLMLYYYSICSLSSGSVSFFLFR